MDSKLLEKTNDWTFVVASAKCDYHNQAFINQSLVIETRVREIGRTSVTLAHRIIDEGSESLIGKGEIILVNFNFSEQKSKRLEDQVVDTLQDYLDEFNSIEFSKHIDMRQSKR